MTNPSQNEGIRVLDEFVCDAAAVAPMPQSGSVSRGVSEQMSLCGLDAPPSDAIEVSLIVLRTQDIESAKTFYSLLGLSFVAEKHGTGPLHYSATIGSLVFEIYPRSTKETISPLRFGFRVTSLDDTIEKLRCRGARIVTEQRDSSRGRWSVIQDPDGNLIELTMLDQRPSDN